MSSKTWRNFVRTTATVACLLAGATAQAGVYYQSDFDPLGFAGSAKWYVDDNCLSSPGSLFGNGGTGYQYVNALGPGCSISLFSLSVQLWDSDGAGGPYPNLAAASADKSGSKYLELTFDQETNLPSSPYHLPFVSDPHLVVGVHVLAGQLAGVDTLLVGPECGANPVDGVQSCFGVQFTSGMSPLAAFGYLFPDSALGNLGVKGAYLWQQAAASPFRLFGRGCTMTQFYGCASEVIDVLTDNESGYATFDTPGAGPSGFRLLGSTADSLIPEPGPLVLLGGALVAGWLTRRRKPAA